MDKKQEVCDICENKCWYPLQMQCKEKHKVCGICYAVDLQSCPICAMRNTRERGRERKTIVVVLDKWDDIMSSTSTIGKDLVSFLGSIFSDMGQVPAVRVNPIDIVCVVSRATQIEKFEAGDRGVALVEFRNNDDDDIAMLSEIGPIETLIGFIPSTLEMTNKINDALAIERSMFYQTDVLQNPTEYRGVLWPLGPKVFNSLTDQARSFIPPVKEEISLLLSDRNFNRFHFIFPLIIELSDPNYLRQQGLEIGMTAIANLNEWQNKTVILLMSPRLSTKTDEIIQFAADCGINAVRFRCPSSTEEWKQEIGKSDLALCTSPTAAYEHWLHKIIEMNVPFLVDAESGIGQVLKTTHPFAVVDHSGTDNAINWTDAIRSAMKDVASTIIDHCEGHRSFLREYRNGFMPLLLELGCGFYEITVRPYLVQTEQENDSMDRKLRAKFDAFTNQFGGFINAIQEIVRQKCQSNLQPDCETEKDALKLYLEFKKRALTITGVRSGSLVFAILSHTKEAAKYLENIHKDDQLKAMFLQCCMGKDVSDSVKLGLDWKKIQRADEQLGNTNEKSSETEETETTADEQLGNTNEKSSETEEKETTASAIQVFRNGAHFEKRLPLSRSFYSIWSTNDPRVLAIGNHYGTNDCIIGLVDIIGNTIKEIKLDDDLIDANHVASGLCINDRQYAVILAKVEGDLAIYKLVIIDIDTPADRVYMVKQMNANQPIKLFDVNRSTFGALCVRDAESFDIKTYDKSSYEAQSEVNISYPEGNADDSIVPTPDGGWLLASRMKSVLYKFSNKGELLETIGEAAPQPNMKIPGHLYAPRAISYDPQNGLLVTCVGGDTHRWDKSKWEIVATFGDREHGVWALHYTKDKVYTVYRNDIYVYNI